MVKHQRTFLLVAAGTLLALEIDFPEAMFAFSAATDEVVAIDMLGSSTSLRVLKERAA